MSENPRYEVLEKSFIDGALLEVGTEIEFGGVPGSRLRPLNAAAEAAKQQGRATVLVESPQQQPEVDEELEQLRQQYEELFNEKPHFNTKADTLREKIAEKRKELGI